ncbi:hypothetical protein NSTCB13_00222 [Nostoc sp. DSM 114160]|jgi:hypothetical protein
MTNPTSSTTEQEAIIDEIIASSLQAQQKTGPDLRQIHSKSHGLVWGEFIIEPNLPEDPKSRFVQNASNVSGVDSFL